MIPIPSLSITGTVTAKTTGISIYVEFIQTMPARGSDKHWSVGASIAREKKVSMRVSQLVKETNGSICDVGLMR